MLSLEVPTKLGRTAAIDKAVKYFIKANGLTFVEARSHLHGPNGAVEVGVTGDSVTGNDPTEWRSILDELTDHLHKTYSLETEYDMLHLHMGDNGEIGHLVVQINQGDEKSIEMKSWELDEIARGFGAQISQ